MPHHFSHGNMPSSEENRLTADKYIDAADNAAAKGYFAKSERLLLKALRLCPLDEVQDLLREVRAKMKEDEDPGSTGGRLASTYAQSSMSDDSADYAAGQCLKKAQAALDRGELEMAERWAAKAQRMKHSSHGAKLLMEVKRLRPRLPTIEQQEALRRASAATRDHDRLGVGQQASTAEIKKAYRKLTLLLHPDKNHAPEAKIAFMNVTDSYSRLLKKSKTPTN